MRKIKGDKFEIVLSRDGTYAEIYKHSEVLRKELNGTNERLKSVGKASYYESCGWDITFWLKGKYIPDWLDEVGYMLDYIESEVV